MTRSYPVKHELPTAPRGSFFVKNSALRTVAFPPAGGAGVIFCAGTGTDPFYATMSVGGANAVQVASGIGFFYGDASLWSWDGSSMDYNSGRFSVRTASTLMLASDYAANNDQLDIGGNNPFYGAGMVYSASSPEFVITDQGGGGTTQLTMLDLFGSSSDQRINFYNQGSGSLVKIERLGGPNVMSFNDTGSDVVNWNFTSSGGDYVTFIPATRCLHVDPGGFNSGAYTDSSLLIGSQGCAIFDQAAGALLTLTAGGFNAVELNSSGGMRLPGITSCNILQTDAAGNVGNGATVARGTYTPTLTNVTNLAASTAYQAQYFRFSDMCIVSGKVDIDPTAAGATSLRMSLPIASNIGAAEDLSGTAFASGIAGQGAAVLGDAANNAALMNWVAVDITNQSMYYVYMYQVI